MLGLNEKIKEDFKSLRLGEHLCSIYRNKEEQLAMAVPFMRFMDKGAAELIGKKCYELVHAADYSWLACPFQETKLDGTAHTSEVLDPHLGIPLLITTSPILNEKKEVIGAVHIARDISERKKMEEELKQRIERMERFQKVTVGRELKMKELKARIAELEDKLGAK